MGLVFFSFAGVAKDFSWEAQLGTSIDNSRRDLEKFSSCLVKSLPYTLYLPIPLNYKFEFKGWGYYQAVGPQGFVTEEDSPSNSITVLECHAHMYVDIEIRILAFENKIFNVDVFYRRCDLRDYICNPLIPTSLDAEIAAQLPDKAPEIDYPFKDPNELYLEASRTFQDPYLNSMLLDASTCGFQVASDKAASTSFRCVVNATASDGIWHSITMAQAFESGWFGRHLVGRFANKQRFTLIAEDKKARAALESEIQSVADVRARAEDERKRNEESLKSVR
jgi:hypothetical protein